MTPHGRREPANRLEERSPSRTPTSGRSTGSRTAIRPCLPIPQGVRESLGAERRERPGGILDQLQGAFRRVFRLRQELR